MALFRQATKPHRGLRALLHLADPHPALGGAGVLASVIGRRDLPGMPGTVPEGTIHRSNVKLSELKPGESGVVAKLLGNGQGRLRLMEMGLTPGAHVKVIHAAAFGGPLQISVRGYQLSLRREEASAVVLG